MGVKLSTGSVAKPVTEIIETETEVILTAKFQDVNHENVSVTLADPMTVELSTADTASSENIFGILSKRDVAVKNAYARVMQQAAVYYQERRIFSPESGTVIQLPVPVRKDAAAAVIEDGILRIVFQKKTL